MHSHVYITNQSCSRQAAERQRNFLSCDFPCGLDTKTQWERTWDISLLLFWKMFLVGEKYPGVHHVNQKKNKKLAMCWEVPMCAVCSKSSNLTKLLGRLKPWKYLRENLSPGEQGLVMVLITFGALYWPRALCTLVAQNCSAFWSGRCSLFFSVSKRALVAIVCSIFLGGSFLGQMWDFWEYFFLL